MVGAGPAGSATAVFLRQRGHDVLLVDEARFPRDKICGESVSPGAWPLLAALGAAARVRALDPFPLLGMRLTSPDGTAFAGAYPAGPESGFAVLRRRLDATLLDVARDAGVEVREGVRVKGLDAGGPLQGLECDEGGSPLRLEARLVVGADGRRSIVARQLGLLHGHPRMRRFAVRGYWEGVQGLTHAGEMHVVPGGYCGIAPLSPTFANVTFVLHQRDMAAARGDLGGFYARSLQKRWPRLAPRLSSARLVSPPSAIGPLALVARKASAPGVLLVGDAAGFFDPFTGEGVTLALRSAEMAADVGHEALAADTTSDLEAYDRRRLLATRDKFRVNRLLQVLVGWPSLADAVSHRLARRPDLADRFVAIAGDLAPARSAFDARFLWSLLWA